MGTEDLITVMEAAALLEADRSTVKFLNAERSTSLEEDEVKEAEPDG